MKQVLGLVKGSGGRVAVALVSLMVAMAAFATTPTVDPAPIAAEVEAQMTAIISAGVALLIFGIVAGVGWRYAKRFLKG